MIAVIAEVPAGHLAGLKAIGAEELGGLQIADHDVVTKGIERIDIETGAVGGGKALAKFEVKYLIAKTLALGKIVGRLGKTDAK